MAKTSGKSNGGGTSSGRPKPMTTKAGYTQTRRRYDGGGKGTN